jgi:serine protease inhibitor
MRRIIGVLLIAALFLLICTACSEGIATKGKKYDVTKINHGVVEGNSQFAFDLFKKLNDEDKGNSIFISPLSISTALTMTYNGAETSTKDAMEKALGFKGIDRDIINESYSNLLNYLQNVDKKIELNIANSIWIRHGQEIKENFLSNNESNFNAEVDTLDFSKNSAISTINKWIDNATKGKINRMLEPPIDPNVIMYLINAIYFKGEWSKQFDPERTYDGTFKTFEGSEQTVKMMSLKDRVLYTEGDDYKAVKLPYGNGKISMYIMLPDEDVSINEFIEDMTVEKWNDIRNNVMETDDVLLQIPRFELEYGIKNLNDSLKALGMEEAFSENADFSGIREGIYISRVLHKAVIEVNEEGSEAAAVTVVEMTESAAMEPITFIADRPFMFIITDDTTGSVLFMGKLLNVE